MDAEGLVKISSIIREKDGATWSLINTGAISYSKDKEKAEEALFGFEDAKIEL